LTWKNTKFLSDFVEADYRKQQETKQRKKEGNKKVFIENTIV
jgi:hypothetical protein